MTTKQNSQIHGEFVDLNGERYYKIAHVDHMAPFFISVVSSDDHWLFAASNGGLTAGRVSPETALFPYVTVDKIYESTSHTGCVTVIKVKQADQQVNWEPFKQDCTSDFELQRNLYKNTLGSKLCFEEVNHSLGLTFRYTWTNSQEYGFCRQVQLQNDSPDEVAVELVDGFRNVLPAGTPRFTQTQSSNLVDAYKFSELDTETGAGIFTLYSGITDRAEPSESLKANVVAVLGLTPEHTLLSEQQLEQFRENQALSTEYSCRGVRGAYLVHTKLNIGAKRTQDWEMIANVERDQGQLVDLLEQLGHPDTLRQAVKQSVATDSDHLSRIMAASDGFQTTAQEQVSVHHYANTLFNVLRGGIFNQQYDISASDLRTTIKGFNREIYQAHQDFLHSLPATVRVDELLQQVAGTNDTQLMRLVQEYLPITFGRRHGDPSRPWNQFAINLKDQQGNPLLSYQGNWRDIFQNWEALTFSYPQFIESVIAKFVNASTVDGYNPYRITKQGIDWEVEEPDDPWSYIGYWGDHQIIYLLKLLELSQQFHPEKLQQMLTQSLFSYANVPYRLKSFEQMLENAKSTVLFDQELAEEIEHRVEKMGADGKLLLDKNGQVYQVNLLEKLLVPLLTKLSNLVIDGGIWLNTQRPEWNDANNALVGQGLSMVTLYYMRRYTRFMQTLLSDDLSAAPVSVEVHNWLSSTAQILASIAETLQQRQIDDHQRYTFLRELGLAASEYRQTVYANQGFSGQSSLKVEQIQTLLSSALACIDHCIHSNRQESGLYHAYNLLKTGPENIQVDHLYPMLEGQVAALSSGAINGPEAVDMLQSLFDSDIYRADQQTFMLYPDREQTPFLHKNRIPEKYLSSLPILEKMVDNNDRRLVYQDARGVYRFNAELKNAGDVKNRLAQMADDYPSSLSQHSDDILAAYEAVFDHQSFTGRSGGMFGFEGLGSIYWHMVSKLLLATQEQFFAAVQQQQPTKVIRRLGQLYYKIRHGIGFNKTPQEYGAFPTDPYSHTPKHAGAQQPGMTGQVKEEVLTRFAELGIRVSEGVVHLAPHLLRAQEFSQQTSELRYLDVREHWQTLPVPANSIAFTWCQVPFIYTLKEGGNSQLKVTKNDQLSENIDGLTLSPWLSRALFLRTGEITLVELELDPASLFEE